MDRSRVAIASASEINCEADPLVAPDGTSTPSVSAKAFCFSLAGSFGFLIVVGSGIACDSLLAWFPRRIHVDGIARRTFEADEPGHRKSALRGACVTEIERALLHGVRQREAGRKAVVTGFVVLAPPLLVSTGPAPGASDAHSRLFAAGCAQPGPLALVVALLRVATIPGEPLRAAVVAAMLLPSRFRSSAPERVKRPALVALPVIFSTISPAGDLPPQPVCADGLVPTARAGPAGVQAPVVQLQQPDRMLLGRPGGGGERGGHALPSPS